LDDDNGFYGVTSQWMPPRLEQVDDDAVEQYFSRMDDPWCKDLNLPTRLYNGINTESKL
jgi:3-hydroxyisobutyryl-CoA hydrolase